MNTVARILTRPDDEKSGGSNLGLVFFTKNGKSAMKGNTVYEIVEFDGELTIREIGPSIMSEPLVEDRHGMPCWGQDITTILQHGGKHLALSADELRGRVKQEQDP